MMSEDDTPRRTFSVDGISINVASLPEAVSRIVAAARQNDSESFSVCTLNLDHVVQLRTREDFGAAYRRARFVTADGFPIALLAHCLGAPIRRTTGADLVEPLCEEAARSGLPIFLFGSDTATLSTSAARLSRRFPGLKIVGYEAPGRNFDPYSGEADAAIERIRASGARLCFLALGAPRQEIFAARCLDHLRGTGLLCIGAALDFIAGSQRRAPSFAQRMGLEWLWRMTMNPRRLAPRYMRCLAAIPWLISRSISQTVSAKPKGAA
jgi:N-acetylglucosaminyldiphosphoundecaprenol N-acetyl-beta-D-mannosaminyltransferase